MANLKDGRKKKGKKTRAAETTECSKELEAENAQRNCKQSINDVDCGAPPQLEKRV